MGGCQQGALVARFMSWYRSDWGAHFAGTDGGIQKGLSDKQKAAAPKQDKPNHDLTNPEIPLRTLWRHGFWLSSGREVLDLATTQSFLKTQSVTPTGEGVHSTSAQAWGRQLLRKLYLIYL